MEFVGCLHWITRAISSLPVLQDVFSFLLFLCSSRRHERHCCLVLAHSSGRAQASCCFISPRVLWHLSLFTCSVIMIASDRASDSLFRLRPLLSPPSPPLHLQLPSLYSSRILGRADSKVNLTVNANAWERKARFGVFLCCPGHLYWPCFFFFCFVSFFARHFNRALNPV